MTAALEKYKAIAYETGSIARLSDAEKTAAEKMALLNQKIKEHEFEGGFLLNDKGLTLFQEKIFQIEIILRRQ